MNETTMTIVGNVVEAPKLRRTKNGHSVANFRVASTPRRFDRDKNAWVDDPTLFVTVTAWRALGENVASSLQKGQPVIVTGRYYQRDFVQNEMVRTAYELEALAVGPDLNRGVSNFQKISRTPMVNPVDLDEDGIPADHSDAYLDLSEEFSEELTDELSGELSVDARTGEVLELAAG